MKLKAAYILTATLVFFFSLSALAQVIEEDTSTNRPFFEAKKFHSSCYVGFEAQPTQILKNQAGMMLGLNLNWVINHKFVLSARYHNLTTPKDIHTTVTPSINSPRYLIHHFAGMGFSYIVLNNKKFSFQPELTVGWCSAKFEYPTDSYSRRDYAVVMPAVYGVYNATKIFRLGIGLNYRAVMGTSLPFYGLKASDLSGIAGVVFIRVGTF